MVFDSAVDDFFLNHSDFYARDAGRFHIRAPAVADFLVRLTRAPSPRSLSSAASDRQRQRDHSRM